ncbi:hypothetical protein [Methylobacterium radiotolerans]
MSVAVIAVTALVFCAGMAIWVDGLKGLLAAYVGVTIALAIATPFTVGLAHLLEAPVVGLMIAPVLHVSWIGVRNTHFREKAF